MANDFCRIEMCTDDLDASVAKVFDLGGKVIMDATPFLLSLRRVVPARRLPTAIVASEIEIGRLNSRS